jgi:Family of unknown function (DUF5681)
MSGAQNSEISAVRAPPRGRPFEPGKSGNPGGRPKGSTELRELARQHAPTAIEELARLALKARSEAVRVSAIRELLDRGYGKTTSLPVAVELPAIGGELKGNFVILAAYKSVFAAVASGHLSSGEALELVGMIEAFNRFRSNHGF